MRPDSSVTIVTGCELDKACCNAREGAGHSVHHPRVKFGYGGGVKTPGFKLDTHLDLAERQRMRKVTVPPSYLHSRRSVQLNTAALYSQQYGPHIT